MATIIIIALLISTAALAEPVPVPKPTGPGGSCPHGYIALVLRPRPGRTGCHRQAGKRHLPVGMDCVGLLLLAKWTRATAKRLTSSTGWL
jgi:hypothetical protein